MDQQLFSFILVKRRLSSYFCQVNSPISFLKQKTVSGAPASFCLDCVNVGKALEDAKAAQEETIKRFHFLFIICNFCFFNSDNLLPSSGRKDWVRWSELPLEILLPQWSSLSTRPLNLELRYSFNHRDDRHIHHPHLHP